MSQESRPDVTGILPGCHRISARIRREGWPDGAGILNKEYHLFFQSNDDGNDDNNLSRFYNEIHLFLYEAARTGNYIVAKEELAQIAHEMGIINYQFQVDEKRIYFFAEKDGSILCKTIELEENRV